MKSWLLSGLVRICLIGATIIVALSGCTTIKTGSHYDQTANFDEYRTFAWAGDDPYVVSESSIRISPLTQKNVQTTIRDAFQDAGYEFDNDSSQADMLVAFTLGTRDKIRVDAYPIRFPGDSGWHIHGSRYTIQEVREHHYTEGTLGIDIFDGKTNQPIWHGWAETRLTMNDRHKPDQIIGEGVAKLFATFPN